MKNSHLTALQIPPPAHSGAITAPRGADGSPSHPLRPPSLIAEFTQMDDDRPVDSISRASLAAHKGCQPPANFAVCPHAMKVPVALLALAALLTSCSSVHTNRNPGVDLSHFKQFYVEHRLTDDHHIDELIVAELKSLGREASAGPLTMIPDTAEAIVTYQDDWAWDFKSYLIQLSIQIRDAHRSRGLAFGSYRQPSMVTKSPAQVIHAIFAPLIKHP